MMLPPSLTANAAQFLPLHDKYHLLLTSRDIQPVLEHRAAWEPLVLGHHALHRLLRRMQQLWKLSSFTLSVLQGVRDVHGLYVDARELDIKTLPVEEQWLHILCPLEQLLLQVQQ